MQGTKSSIAAFKSGVEGMHPSLYAIIHVSCSHPVPGIGSEKCERTTVHGINEQNCYEGQRQGEGGKPSSETQRLSGKPATGSG